MKRLASAELPTDRGNFRIMAFGNGDEQFPHVAMVKTVAKSQDTTEDAQNMESCMIFSPEDVALVRIHSECMTGDVFGSRRCECGDQLEMALDAIGKADAGVLVYLRQEGRGIGLVEKLKAYNLQDEGLDTFEANVALGHAPDARDFSEAIAILKKIGVTKVQLLTNNPQKVQAFVGSGIEVLERVSLMAPENESNSTYLEAKRRVGHFLS